MNQIMIINEMTNIIAESGSDFLTAIDEAREWNKSSKDVFGNFLALWVSKETGMSKEESLEYISSKVENLYENILSEDQMEYIVNLRKSGRSFEMAIKQCEKFSKLGERLK